MLSDDFATALADLIGREARTIIQMRQVKDLADTSVAVGLIEWETHEMEQVIADQTIPETTRHAVVMARRGQGLFKQNVKRNEAFCRVTKVDRNENLRARNCKKNGRGSWWERMCQEG